MSDIDFEKRFWIRRDDGSFYRINGQHGQLLDVTLLQLNAERHPSSPHTWEVTPRNWSFWDGVPHEGDLVAIHQKDIDKFRIVAVTSINDPCEDCLDRQDEAELTPDEHFKLCDDCDDKLTTYGVEFGARFWQELDNDTGWFLTRGGDPEFMAEHLYPVRSGNVGDLLTFAELLKVFDWSKAIIQD